MRNDLSLNMERISGVMVSGLLLLSLGTMAKAQTPEPTAPPETEQTTPALPGDNQEEYRIGVGDTLEVAILLHPELSKQVTVAPDGRITYPYIGTLYVVGLSLPEFSAKIEKGLGKEIAEPKANTTLIKRADQTINVIGSAVQSPGNKPMRGDWRILDVLGAAGSLTVTRIDTVGATLFRKDKTIPIDLWALLVEGDTSQNLKVEAGDTLVVEVRDMTRTHINVQGEVVKAGWVPVPSDHSLMSLLNAAGGTTPKASLTRAAIKRGKEIIPIDLSKMNSDINAASFTVQAGDTLFIPMNQKMYAVMGAVLAPKQYGFPDNEQLNVMRAISNAGGVSPQADLKKATVIRGAANSERDVEQEKRRKIGEAHSLLAGQFMDAFQYATGTALLYPASQTIAVGTTTPATRVNEGVTTTLDNAYKQTLGASKTVLISVNLEDILKKGDLKQDVTLQPGDVVYIPSKNPSRNSFGLQQALGFLPFLGFFR